jgi:transcription termination factor Rho
VTDTSEIAPAGPGANGAGPRTPNLSTLRLPELQAVAAQLGIGGTARMRKSDLVTAIQAHQGKGANSAAPAASAVTSNGHGSGTPEPTPAPRTRGRRAAAPAGPPALRGGDEAPQQELPIEAVEQPAARARGERRSRQPVEQSAEQVQAQAQPEAEARSEVAETRSEVAEGDRSADQPVRGEREPVRRENRRQREPRDGQARDGQARDGQVRDGQARDGQARDNQVRDGQARDGQARDGQARDGQTRDGQTRDGQARDGQNGQGRDGQGDYQARQQPQQQTSQQSYRDDDDEDGDGRGRRRRGRYRDRKRRGRDGQPIANGVPASDEPDVADDDVLVPVAGILDVLENYAFVRTSGYLPGPNDVYVSLGQVKRYGLRKGDAVVGAVRALRDGETPQPRQQKFNALVRLDTVNGASPDEARARPDFGKLTPLYPQERLRLETEPNVVATRLIDLVAPIGKGQRGLIVSPPKAGKTLILQAIANAITTNNPECHLMVVLVDERPEEVTDMQRTVKGEVIASTFDRPAEDHTTVAELAIERAKRLVELGHDVVVLLDSITRLGRAYNLAAPASGRILSGGVDSSALYPPKRFFGAARNIENGGSLTILATALVETGSKMDEVIFEEFKGTGNMELRLSRQLADKRVFPAIDVNPSGTRREEILMSKEELAIVWKLRRVLSALESQQAIELLLDRVRQSRSNLEFLMNVQKTTPVPGRGDDD